MSEGVRAVGGCFARLGIYSNRVRSRLPHGEGVDVGFGDAKNRRIDRGYIAGRVIAGVEFTSAAYVGEIGDGGTAAGHTYRHDNGRIAAPRIQRVRPRAVDECRGRRRASPRRAGTRARGQAEGQAVLNPYNTRSWSVPYVAGCDGVGS